jgi:hypothetical protein
MKDSLAIHLQPGLAERAIKWEEGEFILVYVYPFRDPPPVLLLPRVLTNLTAAMSRGKGGGGGGEFKFKKFV